MVRPVPLSHWHQSPIARSGHHRSGVPRYKITLDISISVLDTLYGVQVSSATTQDVRYS